MKPPHAARPRIGLLLEQTLGHVTHAANLRESLADAADADVLFRDIEYEPSGLLDRYPPRSNWTVRAGRHARAAAKELEKDGVDSLFVHTQVPAVMLGRVMDRVPTIVSVDATPKQIDSLGIHYNHAQGSDRVEDLKFRANRRCFEHAASLVAWSEWAADGLEHEYGIDRAKIDVLHPGVIPDAWRRIEAKDDSSTVKILFVGGDLPRKGGDLLIDAVRRLRERADIAEAGLEVELHLATGANLPNEPGIIVHNGLTPNSAELISLYHQCDVFALPTHGDCLPMVLGEAAVCEMPLVSTAVGAIPEIVRDGETGHIVEHRVESIEESLVPLIIDRDYRRKIGLQAAAHAEAVLDARANARRILDRLIEHADRARPRPVTLCVSGDIPTDLRAQIERKERPLADYVAIADECGAQLVDRPAVATHAGPMGKLLHRVAGPDIAMAWHLFGRRRDLDVVITDGEQVGYPLALMMGIGGRRGLRHIMIGHRLTSRSKVLGAKRLGLFNTIDEVLLYSSKQVELTRDLIGVPDAKIRLIDFMVDTEFFSPQGVAPPPGRPLISTAGREFRDYPTMLDAVAGLDADVVVASASPWSKRDDNAGSAGQIPDNVTVTKLTQAELRDMIDRSTLVVVPVLETDFQAGITTILEGMAMGKAVVVSHTTGQTDVIIDGENGRYVEPGDASSMRLVIEELLADPEQVQRLGTQAREDAVSRMDVRSYASVFAEAVERQRGQS